MGVNRRIANSYKFILSLTGNVIQSYMVNMFKAYSIHNDLGASATSLMRRHSRLEKRALQSDTEEKLIDEMNWMLKLNDTEMEKYLPKIFSYSQEPNNTYYVMKYYNMPNFRKVILEGMNTYYFIEKRLELIVLLQKNLLYLPKYEKQVTQNYFQKVFIDKFLKRIADTQKKVSHLTPLLQAGMIKVNGTQLLGSSVIMDWVQKSAQVQQALTPEKLYYSHGDLHSNNILCGLQLDHIKLIDCRGKSTDGSEYFDVAYDLAKLFHDFEGLYTFIERHMYTLTSNYKDEVEYEMQQHPALLIYAKLNVFLHDCIGKNYKNYGDVLFRSLFIEAQLFLTMLPFHLKIDSETILCYTRGVELLNSWMLTYYREDYIELFQKTKLELQGEQA